MAHVLPPLPYAPDALAPILSAETLGFHHGKHHAAYVNKLNTLVAGTTVADWSLEQLMHGIDQVPTEVRKGVWNCAAQTWNHTFYWNGLSPNGGAGPTGALASAIDASFGNLDGLKAKLNAAALNHFASGWGWLVKRGDGQLAVVDSHDADCPLVHGMTPLWTIDVWEHAYYVDYRNDRGAYIGKMWELANWTEIARRFGG